MTPRIILAAEARTALIAAVSWWRANRPLAPLHPDHLEHRPGLRSAWRSGLTRSDEVDEPALDVDAGELDAQAVADIEALEAALDLSFHRRL